MNNIYEDFVEIRYHCMRTGMVYPVTIMKDIITKNLNAGTIEDLVNIIIEKLVKEMRVDERLIAK